jgi:hypothetical protein
LLRLTFLLRRKPELSFEDYYRYWLEEHGPLVASFANDLNMVRYVQVHSLRDDAAVEASKQMAEARGGMEAPYDGVAEVWYENREALVDAMSTKAGRAAGRALVEDEVNFIDLPNSPLWLCHEFPQVNPTPENIVARPRGTIVKLYFPLRMRRDLDLQEAHRYWYSNHGPIIRRQAAGSGILRYMQVHRVPDELEQGLREARGTVVDPYDGHAEVWFDRGLQSATPERTAAGRRAVEDESNFIDFKRSTMWLAKEHVFVDHM